MAAYQIVFIYLMFLLLACAPRARRQITVDSIKVIPVNQQAYVNEHCRKLLIQNSRGHIVDEESLYCDPGATCLSSLFDTEDTFTLIDCNGDWYSIDKVTGDLEKTGRQWQKDLPSNYIGTFQQNTDSSSYRLQAFSSISTDKIYTINHQN